MKQQFLDTIRKWCAGRDWTCTRCGKTYRPYWQDIKGVVTRSGGAVASTHCPLCTAYQILKCENTRDMGLTILHR